jgi:hypothetical protein
MVRKLTLMVATAAVCSAMPQIAAASCGGNACSAFSFAGGKFTNKDKDRKIDLTYCIIKASGTCSSPPTKITIDQNSSKAIPVPTPSGGDVKVDVQTAAFIGAPPTNAQITPPGCDLSMDKKNCELQRDLKDTQETRKRRDQARKDLDSARNQYSACTASPVKLPILDFCAATRDKVNKLVTEILSDDKKLGETEPGAPLRLETVLDTTPIPAKQDGDTADKTKKAVEKKIGCVPGSPDNPKDIQGNPSGVFNGTTGGCSRSTDVGGGGRSH